jgi:ABC-2 type transport system permease protein
MTIWFDLLAYSTMAVVVFGFLSRYLAGDEAGMTVIMGMLLWELLRVNQYCVSVNSMWQIWSHNLTNLFIAPISTWEYVAANCVNALVKSLVVCTVTFVMSWLAFGFNILDIGVATLAISAVLLIVFGWGLGFLLLGYVFRYGTSVQALTWGAVVFLQPLTAAFYPVAVMPEPIQWLAWTLPPAYVFEGARYALAEHAVDWPMVLGGVLTDVVWFVGGMAGFVWLFRRSRVVGQFARNDS